MERRNIKSILFLNFAAILRSFLGLIRTKFTSLWLGVEGVGILGQIVTYYGLQTRTNGFGAFSLLINQIGKIDVKEEQERYFQLISFVITLLTITNLIFLTIQLIFVNVFSKLLFDSEKFIVLILLMIFIGPVFSISQFWEILTRAHREFRKLAIGQNITFLSGILTIIPALYIWGIQGIIYNFYFFLIINFLFFFIVSRKFLYSFSLFKFRLIPNNLNFFFRFCFVSASKRLLMFGSLIVFRIFIVQYGDMTTNGYFQSIWSIFNLIGIVPATFTLYLFPTLSNIKSSIEPQNFKNELNSLFEYLLYMIFPIVALVMIFPELILKILFTNSFLIMSYPLAAYAFLQVLNAIYKFYTITFLSQSRLRSILIIEIIRYSGLILFSFFAIRTWHLTGAVWSIIFMEIITFAILSYFISS